MKIGRSIPVSAALCVLAACALTACNKGGRGAHSLYTEATVSRNAFDDARAVVDRAKQQIIARGQELGLTVTETAPDRLVVTAARAPASIGASRMADERTATGTAEFRVSAGNINYRYWVDLSGKPPQNTTPAHEQAVLAGIFMIRGVFDRPLDINTAAIPTP